MEKPAQTSLSAPVATFQDVADQDIAEAVSVRAVVSHYFETLSAEDFQATADLFTADGVLYPPFESGVIGREAIVVYLETEAKGLRLAPLEYEIDRLEDSNIQCRVTGKVQTPLFGVNVGWLFVLNAAAEILSVRVKLLAALEELLKLKPASSEP